jgi:hypothetical protein
MKNRLFLKLLVLFALVNLKLNAQAPLNQEWILGGQNTAIVTMQNGEMTFERYFDTMATDFRFVVMGGGKCI